MSDTARTCLLVDDDESMLNLLSHCVQHLGFTPITAQDGDEGFAAFQEAHPDLIISDIHMPNRNGLLLLQDIKKISPDIPFILITGWLHFKAAIVMEKYKPDAYLEKPFTLDQLQEVMAKLVPELKKLR